VWLSVWREVHIVAYGPADATAKMHHLLSHLNPNWFYVSGTSLPRCPGKKPLNRCSSSSCNSKINFKVLSKIHCIFPRREIDVFILAFG